MNTYSSLWNNVNFPSITVFNIQIKEIRKHRNNILLYLSVELPADF